MGPSPAWLKARLLLTGSRPRNNVVDVTNYVLYEFGQPLHAFDFAKVRGGRIVVRRMTPGESIALLADGVTISADGQPDRKFANPPLVIADAERPIALAGIMGGAETQTTDHTNDVLLEAAYFDPANIRKTAREARLGTDSSYRFERGTDPNQMLDAALGRALHLITELAGGNVSQPLADQYPARREPRTFRLGSAKTSSYLGMPVSAETIRDSLTRLRMDCSQEPSGEISVRVPTWRTDVNDPVVLIEDVARMVGYDQIPVAPKPAAPTLGIRSPADRLRQTLSNYLIAAGFYESRNPSLEPPEMSDWLAAPGPRVALTNPQSREMSVLRRSLLPGLLKTVDNNIRRGADAVRFFEIDRAFDDNAGQQTADAWRVGGISGGRARQSDWRGGGQQVDFYDLKGSVEDLLDTIGCSGSTFHPAEVKPFLTGTAAQVRISCSTELQPVGIIGELDPAIISLGRLPYRLFAFELDLHALQAAANSLNAYRPLSRQPAVTRDLAFVVKADVVFDDLSAAMREAAGQELESLRFVDYYVGAPVPQGHKSLAFHLVFRDPARTLTAEEVSAIMDRVIGSLKNKFAAEIREK